MSIETILLAVGPGDRNRTDALIREAINIAEPTGAEVVLLHVFSEDEYEATYERLGFDPDDETVTPDTVSERHATIRSLSDALESSDIEYRVLGAIGDKGDEIVAAATEVDADRVFVGGRERSPTGKALFGSVAQQVMLSAPCPVIFVRSDLAES